MSVLISDGSPWIEALGWTLLHFVWQGALVGVAFAGARALWPRHRCNARYATGLLALLMLAVWPVMTFIALIADTGGGPAGAMADGGIASGGPLVTAAATLPTMFDGALPWLVAAWGAGVLVMFARALRDWRSLSLIARRWAESHDDLDAMLAALSGRFGFLRRVRILVSARVDTPMLIGWLRPIVLLPAAVVLRFPREQLELIIAHELGHLRRYDHLVNLAQALLETLLFYHPVVHWISRDVRNERELCCDDLVLRITAGQRRDYARTLASLEELRQGSSRLALAASGGQLVERVRRIAGLPAQRAVVGADGPGRWTVIVAVLCVALFAVQKLDRDDAVLALGAIPADWLVRPDVRALPLATLALPFERLKLTVAAPAASALPIAPSVPVAATRTAAASDATVLRKPDPAVAVDPVPRAALPTPEAPAAIPSAVTPAADAPTTLSLPGAALASVAVSTVQPATATPAATTRAATPAETTTPRVEAGAVAVRPVAIRTVAPEFPTSARSGAGHVDASFSIAADGTLRDIRIGGGGGGDAFAAAALRALRQWRFDPDRLPANRSERYSQSFVFAGAAKKKFDHDDCLQSTGSMICRPVGSSANPLTTIYARGEATAASP